MNFFLDKDVMVKERKVDRFLRTVGEGNSDRRGEGNSCNWRLQS